MAKTVVIDSETKALLGLGFVRPLDIAILIIQSAVIFVLAVWWTTGRLNPTWGIIGLWLVMMLTQVWTLSVAYRACYFILKTQADVNLLPEHAAKLAVRHIEHTANAGVPAGKSI